VPFSVELPRENEKWAVLGSAGMFGRQMFLTLEEQGKQVEGFSREDLLAEAKLEEVQERLGGSTFVINALAFTQVDDAEGDPNAANEVNGHFVGRLAKACEQAGALLFHVSTDYVFDGLSSDPYPVDAAANPQTAYGRSKLLGEQAIKESAADFTIFRTSWLYGKTGSNFPKTIANKLMAGQPVRVVADEFGSPTSAKDLSDLIMRYAELDRRPSIVHATASGSCSWYEFAREIAISLNLDPDELVIPVSSVEFETLAKRPKYSVLDNTEGPIEPIGNWRERWRAQSSEVLLGLQ